MGLDISSCCGGAGSQDTRSDDIAIQPPHPFITEAGRQLLKESDIKDFREQFLDGVNIDIIQKDKPKLPCVVRLSSNDGNSYVTFHCNNNQKIVPIKDIKRILHRAEELKRVDCTEGALDETHCAALHLSVTGTCIPMRFDNGKTKVAFVKLVSQDRAAA